MLREKNLTLLLNTEIYEVELDAGRVAALHGVQQSSERQFHIEADYFIDATGDGTVSAKAGVPFSVGNGNHETLGNSILYITPTICHILRRSSAAAGASSTNG